MFLISRYLLVVVFIITVTPGIWANTLVRCVADIDKSNDQSHSIYTSHINFSFDAAVLQKTDDTGMGKFINLDIDHIEIDNGELLSHFRAHSSDGELMWIKHNHEVFDILANVDQSLYLLRFSLNKPWPQKVNLLFSHTPYPNIAVRKIETLLCQKKVQN